MVRIWRNGKREEINEKEEKISKLMNGKKKKETNVKKKKEKAKS